MKSNLMKPLFPILLTTALILTVLVPAEQAAAQWSAGASYEVRDEDPTNGFGFRLQNDILSGLPVIDIGLRGHFSFFNEEIDAEQGSYTTEIDTYDFGLAAYGGIEAGLVKPYVGMGLGSENYKAVRSDAENQSFDENNYYWNVFIGTEVLPIPVIRPFIEYRFTRMFEDTEFDYKQNSRLAVGVAIHF